MRTVLDARASRGNGISATASDSDQSLAGLADAALSPARMLTLDLLHNPIA